MEETKNKNMIPAIRIEGFNDDWEKHKLGDLVIRTSNKTSDSLLSKVEYEDIIPDTERLNKNVTKGDFLFLSSNDNDSEFLYYLMQTQKFQEIVNQSTGTGMSYADWDSVSNTYFYVPQNIDEQHKIGELFKELDGLITLNQKKVEQLQHLKEALMEKMFI